MRLRASLGGKVKIENIALFPNWRRNWLQPVLHEDLGVLLLELEYDLVPRGCHQRCNRRVNLANNARR